MLSSAFTAYQNNAVSSIHDPHSSLGQQFTHLVQSLVGRGVPAFAASKAAMEQILGEIFNPNGLIFRTHSLQGLNNAYLVTVWLSIATMLLAFTLLGRPKKAKDRGVVKK